MCNRIYQYLFTGLLVMTFSACGREKNGASVDETQQKSVSQKLVRGAQITGFKWGEITVRGTDNKIYQFKDAKFHNVSLGASEWDWKKNGTTHNPGIVVADIKELIDAENSPETIAILSKGVDEVLQTTPEAIAYLNEQKQKRAIKAYHILQSEKAVKLYNELNEKGERVVALIHSTC